MEILELKVMKGPNYWSVTEPRIIVMRVDITSMENYSSRDLQNIVQYMENSLPGVDDLQTIRQFSEEPVSPQWAGHAIGIIALYLQRLAGHDLKYYEVRGHEAEPGILQILFAYRESEAGRFAAKSAFSILNSLLSLSPFDLQKEVDRIRDLINSSTEQGTQQMADDERRKNGTSRIPIVGVTGTNGKTTTTRLVAHMAKTMGYSVGFTSSDGITVNGKIISKGDSSGPKSAAIVLSDPTVNFAVLECARGGMLRSGLAFDHCDVAIVTNVAADHLGLKGIYSVEDMASVKGVLPRTVLPDGYAVLNADDDLVYAMGKDLSCNIAYFSMHPENQRIKNHFLTGGMAATIENGFVFVLKGATKIQIEKIEDIPITLSGRADFMVQNVLAATLAGMARNFPVEKIRLALQTFFPSPEQTPGRLNLFKFKDFEVMVDYAHNPHGYMAIKSFLEKMPARHKVGIIAGTGDRRPEDIIAMGRIAAEMFDEVVVRHDKDLRGNTKENIESSIRKGLEEGGAKKIRFISDEREAVAYVIENAVKDSFITICSEYIEEVVQVLREYQKEENGVAL